ncbi:T9SS type A sorting domain-containing protein [Prevotella sp. oral taxon 475]|uniref:T9SS type A sorting domain-containing protein n=1 Tax=Prevotella sp. oral taxon 475 TaxID=712471 RepID=UPI001BA62A2C|nr:T9SS type A sorting domain-containing protein [Prevotella sp. oral taxon 475]QUB46529.1 T9SS type A sorting domain-containing protein [Prevotella sp. oral taxon 475]
MTKVLLTLSLLATILMGNPIETRANNAIELIDNDFQSIVITVTESTLHVSGAAGQMLAIYDVAGIRVVYLKVESSDKRFELNLPKGCYIVKVGKVVRKIAIR